RARPRGTAGRDRDLHAHPAREGDDDGREHERRRSAEGRHREYRHRHRERAVGRPGPTPQPRLRRTLRPPCARTEPARAELADALLPGAPLASPLVLASVTSSVTSFIGDYGLYAIFLLMVVDAVFPAASELVMLYGGALAAGAFSGQHVVLFGHQIDSHFWAYVAVSLAGVLGNTVGSLIGWAIGAYGGRPLLEERGRWFHLDRQKLARVDRWFERWGDWTVFLARMTPV